MSKTKEFKNKRGQNNREVKRSKKEVKTINRKNAEQVLYDFVD